MKTKKNHLNAYSLTEILIVLAIIGILIMLVLPNQSSVVSQAKSIEAQNMLNHVYGLQKNYFFKYSKYAQDLDEIGFEQSKTVSQGGQAVYNIEIIEATLNSFKARATAEADFDGDGTFNVWEIDQEKNLKEVTRD